MSLHSSGTPTGTYGIDSGGSSVAHSIIEDLSDVELEVALNELKVDARRLELENIVFEHFLQKNDPSLLTGIVQAMDTYSRLQAQTSPGSLERRSQESVVGRSISVVKFTGASSTIADRNLRVNLSQKTDLVIREIEETQTALEKFIGKSHRKKCNLKAEMQEIEVRQKEIEDAKRIFEQNVVIDGIDQLTGRIPAEKFVRFMEEWFKGADATIEQMRLKTSSLKSEHTKIVNQISVKEELGETIHPVDFDKLRIENQYLSTKIEEKNLHLLELKKMTGTANLVLSTSKKMLQKQVEQLKELQASIKEANAQIIHLDKEGEETEEELRDTQIKYDHLSHFKDNYIVPEVIDYIRLVTKMAELDKDIKVWSRKNSILQFGLNTNIRAMKTITGRRKPEKWWFSHEDAPDSIDNIFAAIKPGYN